MDKIHTLRWKIPSKKKKITLTVILICFTLMLWLPSYLNCWFTDLPGLVSKETYISHDSKKCWYKCADQTSKGNKSGSAFWVNNNNDKDDGDNTG